MVTLLSYSLELHGDLTKLLLREQLDYKWPELHDELFTKWR